MSSLHGRPSFLNFTLPHFSPSRNSKRNSKKEYKNNTDRTKVTFQRSFLRHCELMKLLCISLLLACISGIFSQTESPSAPVAAGTASIVLSTGIFSQQEVNGLNAHNRLRAIHDAPNMTLDREMCDSAAQWARNIAELGSLEHSTEDARPNQGENLSMGCSTDKPQTVQEAVTNWYNEVCTPGYFGLGELETGPDNAGHFSQVVWKESTVLGIGRAEIEQDGMKCAYIVGRYKPPGWFKRDCWLNTWNGSYNERLYQHIGHCICNDRMK